MSIKNASAEVREVRVGPLARVSPKRFRVLRDLAGMTLNQLGKSSDIDYTSLSRFESGFKELTVEQMMRAVQVMRRAIQRRAAVWQSILAEDGGEIRSLQSSTLSGL